MKTVLVLTTVLLVGFGCRGFSATLDVLRGELDLSLKVVEEPIMGFQNRYEEELRKLGDASQKNGKLEALLQVRQEIKSFRIAAEPKPGAYDNFPQLQAMRKAYVENLARLRADAQLKQRNAYLAYQGKLLTLKSDLTKQGQVEDALTIAAEEKRIQALLANPPVPGASPTPEAEEKVLWELRSNRDVQVMGGCQMEKKKGAFVLTGTANAKMGVESDKSFAPPFRIVARATTDSHDLRFFYGRGLGVVIFNRIDDLTVLRIQNPDGILSPKPFPGKGLIRQGEMHDLEIRISPTLIEAYADGELRGSLEGDFSKINTPVGIGPCAGSIVTVERFVVLALDEKK